MTIVPLSQRSLSRFGDEEKASWFAALSGNCPAELVETLSNTLMSAKDLDERAMIRDRAASQFLNFHQNSNNLVVLLNLIFESHNKEEFNAQLETSSSCKRLHALSQQELADDQQRARDDEDVSTARCTTVGNWGFEFLRFAAMHKWFDKVTSPYKKFWREARSASNRVKEWQDAKSILNRALLSFHLTKKDWNAVIRQGYWTMVRTQDLSAIQAGAPRLDQATIGRLHLQVDHNGNIDFSNWMQVVNAANSADTSSQPGLETIHQSSISLTATSRSIDRERTRRDSIQEVQDGTTDERLTSKKRKRGNKDTSTVKETPRNHYPKSSRPRRALCRAATDAAEEPRDQSGIVEITQSGVDQTHEEQRDDSTKHLLVDVAKAMRDTLNAGDNELLAEEDILDRDKLYRFALSTLLCLDGKAPQLAAEWSPGMSHACRAAADILNLTESEAVRLVSSTEESIDKLFVIRGEPPCAPRLDWLLEAMNDVYGSEAELDVQGDGTSAQAHRESLMNVSKLLRQKFDANHPREFVPTNCLNIPSIYAQEDEPAFLKHPRFLLGSLICQRLVVPEHERGRPQPIRHISKDKKPPNIRNDLHYSENFSLLSTQGTVSRFHKDAWNCTWVKCLSGIKAWYFIVANAESSEMHEPNPEDIRLVILEPGHTLYMPAGVPVPHAVITLQGPCLMVGGQRLDRYSLQQQLIQIHKTILEPESTNEVVPWSQFQPILLDVVAQVRSCPSKFRNPQALLQSIKHILEQPPPDDSVI